APLPTVAGIAEGWHLCPVHDRLAFSKWEGAGNDFIVIDDPERTLAEGLGPAIGRLCDRHFGIGSDGILLIQPAIDEKLDFEVDFINPDGSRSFCGNGSRCAFGHWAGQVTGRDTACFRAIDGIHEAAWLGKEVAISMLGTEAPERIREDVDQLHTGSPHLICWVDDLDGLDLRAQAHLWRYGPRYASAGINVNFVRSEGGRLFMRTYERGVEDETLSCGTGVTAAALSALHRGLAKGRVSVRTRGGNLQVEASLDPDGRASGIRLIGPVRHVFSGTFEPSNFL
ncbi:MAG: diaminopimelate epimerase, partial [Flavobacteriales bacterium]|nr:diaminopimelate epimerase [Flavobacteriales bacterium]